MIELEPEHDCVDHASEAIDLVILARPRDLGGFSVRRTLPSARRRLVGPFVFFDHMGPAQIQPGGGMDVRPHPHIGLATLTYLFEGEVLHKDSLGSVQHIRPGDVNWMIAGHGIVHSERTPPEVRARGHRSHGLQAWIALHKDEEERAPKFLHTPASALPYIVRQGVEIRLVSGEAFGHSVPPLTITPTLYADIKLSAGASLEIPIDHEDRAIYVVLGAIGCEGSKFEPGAMIVLKKGAPLTLRTDVDSRVMLLGGAPIDGPRLVWWNFVARTQERLDQAKQQWKDRKFPSIPGDDVEYIPLPDR